MNAPVPAFIVRFYTKSIKLFHAPFGLSYFASVIFLFFAYQNNREVLIFQHTSVSLAYFVLNIFSRGFMIS